MSIKDFYNQLKHKKLNNELNNLYRKPVPENRTQMPVSQVFYPNIYYQADLLYMPTDNKYKYILVCVDLYDGKIDAEKLMNKFQEDIIYGFKNIFKRKILKIPKFITFDKGSEFGSEVKKYFNKKKCNVRYALTGRHRMLANVERANQKIASVLFKRMTNQELLQGEENKEWTKDLKGLIRVLNYKKNKKTPLKQPIQDFPIVDKYSGKLLKIGQKVRILLDYPINNTNEKRLNGNFRSTDTRWTKDLYTITEIILKPGFPPMYLTDKNDNIARTKNQFQKYRKGEKLPDSKFNRSESEYGVILKILSKRFDIVNGRRKKLFLVKWKDGTESEILTDEFNRNKTLKEMRKKFNSN